MKKLLYLVLAGLLAACSAELSPNDVAAQAAKVYYEYLLKGDYAAFVDGHYRQDSIPRSYREQLITNAKMFVGQQQTERRGLKEVRIVRAEADTALHVASVFMLFTYGVWYLR